MHRLHTSSHASDVGERFRPTAGVPSLAHARATWTIKPCDPREAAGLAQALGVSETTASVLVRRGYGDADAGGGVPRRGAARARSVSARRHAGGVRPDPRRDRGRHGASASTATTTSTGSARPRSPSSTLRELGAEVEWHLPSRFEEGYGVAGETLARLAAEGCGLVLTVDCGITAVDEVAEAKAAGLEVIVTDHHRPGDELPDCPDRRDPPVRLPVPGALRHRRRLQARARRCSGRPSERSPGTSTSSRSRRSPTSSRSSTRTARWRSPGCAASRRPRGPACAR